MNLLLAFLTGFLAGAWHLAVTAVRARAVVEGSIVLAVLSTPIGWLGPAAVVLGAAILDPAAIGAALVGLIVSRLALVGPLGRRLQEGAWTR